MLTWKNCSNLTAFFQTLCRHKGTILDLGMLLCCRTDVEPDEETSADAEAILRERRPTCSNKDELLELMRQTRNVRRSWISSMQPTITDIGKRYPRLLDIPEAVS